MQKKTFSYFSRHTYIFLTALFLLSSCGGEKTNNTGSELEGTINISGAFALYPMAVKWSEEFKKLHPDVEFNVSAGGAGKGIADALSGMVEIGLASRDIHPEEIKKGAFIIAVTKDAVIPTFNEGNPNTSQILTRGIKKEELQDIFVTEKIKDWNQIAGLTASSPIHAYTRSDAAGAAETFANYLEKSQEDLKGVGVFGDPGLAQAIKKDPSAIGYNNMAFLYDLNTRKQNQGAKALPIDVNGNGKIDDNENFYDNLDVLANAISKGQYPSPPARNLYFLFKGKPQKKELVEFVKYILTDGQKFVKENGYIGLSEETIKEELKKVQ